MGKEAYRAIFERREFIGRELLSVVLQIHP